MFVIFDECNIGIGPEPSGGLTLKLSNIDSLPGGMQIGVPIGKESAIQLITEATKILGLPSAFNLNDLKKEIHGAPGSDPRPPHVA